MLLLCADISLFSADKLAKRYYELGAFYKL